MDITTLKFYELKTDCPYCISFSSNIKNTICRSRDFNNLCCKNCNLVFYTTDSGKIYRIILPVVKIKRRTYITCLDFVTNKTTVLYKLNKIAEYDLININPANVREKLKTILLFK